MTGHALKSLALDDLVVHILGDSDTALESVEIFRRLFLRKMVNERRTHRCENYHDWKWHARFQRDGRDC